MRTNGKPQLDGKPQLGWGRVRDHPSQSSEGTDDDPASGILSGLGALGEYIAHLAAAKADLARVRARNLGVAIAAGAVGAVIALTMILSFWFYFLGGAAGGLSVAVGNRAWLGNLLAGGMGLAIAAVVALLLATRMRRSQRRARIRKYEERKAKQRVRFGRDAEQVAGYAD